MASRSVDNLLATEAMSARYLAMSSLDDGVAGVPDSSQVRASLMSWVPDDTRSAI
ncbi:Uncharacterised protein [Mycobacteroides abscessus subsp. abscessus]|uniref:hypothetical protein n=1 Tax=Mycobacteroides abscessus TaxID=36809 RepID=UPI0005DBBA3A|nr:hypothetical protein [Mycobacteroides abscessus]MDB2220710.1 hypothetical protein [Mycobacteroides abscessus subsp. abscessus]CPR84197.1 Uncharacterised protein [Mycobacteroides abscessus]SID00196.1 Uncharacterised protein [Mycobacteroides abscessus subsp. abscessus]SIL39190.1 Uncharacterised protein [Mycobacteroides abscessus subsp. abscessus]SIM11624.1 Uncharacterised protein [Mycobacteroides abscessus subsp. abscessus]